MSLKVKDLPACYEWDYCVFVSKNAIDNTTKKLMSLDKFFLETVQENRLLVLFALNLLEEEEIKAAKNLIENNEFYSMRVKHIKFDMARLNFTTPDEYLNFTNNIVAEHCREFNKGSSIFEKFSY